MIIYAVKIFLSLFMINPKNFLTNNKNFLNYLLKKF